MTVVLDPLLLTVPFKLALVANTALAGVVVTEGAVALHAGDEVTSVKVPRLAPAATPEIVEVPAFVILPPANGEDAVGRICMPCHLSVFVRVLISVTVKDVMAVAVIETTANEVPVAILLIFLEAVPFPVSNTLTVAAVLNSNPAGAFRTMVPTPISPAFDSAITGLVSVVHTPAASHPGAVFDAIEVPPLAGVVVAAITHPPKTNCAISIHRKIE